MLLPGSEARSVPSRKVRGQADTGGNVSAAVCPPINSCPPSFLHLLSLTHTHTHRPPEGKETSSQSPDPRPRGQQLSGTLTADGGLRFPRGNPPVLLSSASRRAGAPHPGPKFPGSRPHPSFLPRGGGRMGLRLSACPRLLVWMDRPLPARFPVALGGIHTSSTQPYKSTCSV